MTLQEQTKKKLESFEDFVDRSGLEKNEFIDDLRVAIESSDISLSFAKTLITKGVTDIFKLKKQNKTKYIEGYDSLTCGFENGKFLGELRDMLICEQIDLDGVIRLLRYEINLELGKLVKRRLNMQS